MPRTYTVPIDNVAITAAQDLAQIKGATGKMLRIRRAWLRANESTPPAGQDLEFRCRVLTATVTDGSGGSAPSNATFGKADQGDAAPTFTALLNNTTKATSSGTALPVDVDGAYILSGYDCTFLAPPTVASSQSFVFELLTAPTASTHFSGGVLVEELG